MNRFYFYEKINGQKLKCRTISKTRIKNIWEKLTDKPLPEIVGVYVSDKKFEEIYNDNYSRANKNVQKKIEQGIKKEWIFKGKLTMDSGFFVKYACKKSEKFLIAIRNKDYIKEKAAEILKHELIHIIDNDKLII